MLGQTRLQDTIRRIEAREQLKEKVRKGHILETDVVRELEELETQRVALDDRHRRILEEETQRNLGYVPKKESALESESEEEEEEEEEEGDECAEKDWIVESDEDDDDDDDDDKDEDDVQKEAMPPSRQG